MTQKTINPLLAKIQNRARKHDRPKKAADCRSKSAVPHLRCKELGHEFLFLRHDRYGCCKYCGEEVLT